MDAAAATDGRYHAAKLTAAAFNEPERIWSEHEEYRAAVLAPSAAPRREMTRDEWQAAVARIHAKMQRAHLVPGAVN
jgi:hypothetical protein